MKKVKSTYLPNFTNQAIKIKVSKKLDSMEEAPFFKKKMAKANKILAIAELPK